MEDARQPGGEDQSANRRLMEGREDVQEQGHAMAEVQRNGGPSVQRILLRERILEQAPNDSWTEFRCGKRRS